MMGNKNNYELKKKVVSGIDKTKVSNASFKYKRLDFCFRRKDDEGKGDDTPRTTHRIALILFFIL